MIKIYGIEYGKPHSFHGFVLNRLPPLPQAAGTIPRLVNLIEGVGGYRAKPYRDSPLWPSRCLSCSFKAGGVCNSPPTVFKCRSWHSNNTAFTHEAPTDIMMYANSSLNAVKVVSSPKWGIGNRKLISENDIHFADCDLLPAEQSNSGTNGGAYQWALTHDWADGEREEIRWNTCTRILAEVLREILLPAIIPWACVRIKKMLLLKAVATAPLGLTIKAWFPVSTLTLKKRGSQ